MTTKINLASPDFADEIVDLGNTYFHDFLRNDKTGECALCGGDPCDERSAPDSFISRYYLMNPDAVSCPVCDGRPT